MDNLKIVRETHKRDLKNNQFFLFFLLLILVLVLGSGANHDYIAYLHQWGNIWQKSNAYIKTGNNYGVFFNFFSYLMVLPKLFGKNDFYFTLIPKIIFVYMYMFSSYLIWQESFCLNKKESTGVFVFLFLNPLVFIFGVSYGSNDCFLAGLTVLSIIFYEQKKINLSAILFAISVSFKFYPLFLVPFFIVSERKINSSFLIFFSSTLALVYVLGYFLWGHSVLFPFFNIESRASKIFSIFRFFRGEFVQKNFDDYSLYCVAASFFITFFIYYKYNSPKIISASLCYSNILLFFKVGHHQFYFLLILLMGLCFVTYHESFKKDKNLLFAAAFFWIWIFVFVALYPITGRYSGVYYQIREFVGAGTFIVHVIFNVFLLKHLIKLGYMQIGLEQVKPRSI